MREILIKTTTAVSITVGALWDIEPLMNCVLFYFWVLIISGFLSLLSGPDYHPEQFKPGRAQAARWAHRFYIIAVMVMTAHFVTAAACLLLALMMHVRAVSPVKREGKQ